MDEKYQELIREANKAVKTADHLVYITYPLVNDIRLLVTITENLNKALLTALEALLQFEYLYKRISYMPKEFGEQIEIFKSYCAPRYNIPRESLLLVTDINKIIEHRKKSPIEFIRSERFIMCTSDYKMRVLNLDKVKMFNAQTKLFISKISGILGVK